MITWLWPGDSPWPVLWSSKSQGNKPWTSDFLRGRNPWANLTYFTLNKQQRQIWLISYRLLFAAMNSQWGLGDLNAIQWWHSGVQQKYHSGLPKWKRAFSLVRKWQRITSQEVPRADLQGNLISLTLTPMPGPKATTADEYTETSLWSTSESDWQKAAGRIPVCHFEPTKGNRQDSMIKKHFCFPCKGCDTGDRRCLTEQPQYGNKLECICNVCICIWICRAGRSCAETL